MEKEQIKKTRKIMDWIPVIEKLIWPFFIILLLIVFKDKINGLYNMATEGRSLEIAGWIKIGEQVKQTTIQSFAPQNSTIEAIEGQSIMIEKGGSQALRSLQTKLKSGTIKQIDIMNIVNHKYYYKEMLIKYISTLGIKYIVFTNNGKFGGWIESSVFSSQLLMNPQESYSYDELKSLLVGIKEESISPKMKTGDALNFMKKNGLAATAVIENKKFKYFINKSDILTSIISSTLLNNVDHGNK